MHFYWNHASWFSKDLYHLGARKIGVVGLPPIGCVPSQRTLGGGITRECVDLRNQAAKSFNSKLAQQLKMLEANLPGSKVIYIDIYTILDNLIWRPSDYGNSILHHMTSICYFVRMLCTSNDPFALSLFKNLILGSHLFWRYQMFGVLSLWKYCHRNQIFGEKIFVFHRIVENRPSPIYLE